MFFYFFLFFLPLLVVSLGAMTVGLLYFSLGLRQLIQGGTVGRSRIRSGAFFSCVLGLIIMAVTAWFFLQFFNFL